MMGLHIQIITIAAVIFLVLVFFQPSVLPGPFTMVIVTPKSQAQSFSGFECRLVLNNAMTSGRPRVADPEHSRVTQDENFGFNCSDYSSRPLQGQ